MCKYDYDSIIITFISTDALSGKSDVGHSHTTATLPVSSQDINSDQYIPTSSLVYSLKQSVSNGKSLIASAITDKGVSTASDATFQTMSNNIRSISATTNWVLYRSSTDGKVKVYRDTSLKIAKVNITEDVTYSISNVRKYTLSTYNVVMVPTPLNSTSSIDISKHVLYSSSSEMLSRIDGCDISGYWLRVYTIDVFSDSIVYVTIPSGDYLYYYK